MVNITRFQHRNCYFFASCSFSSCAWSRISIIDANTAASSCTCQDSQQLAKNIAYHRPVHNTHAAAHAAICETPPTNRTQTFKLQHGNGFQTTNTTHNMRTQCAKSQHTRSSDFERSDWSCLHFNSPAMGVLVIVHVKIINRHSENTQQHYINESLQTNTLTIGESLFQRARCSHCISAQPDAVTC